MIQLVLYLGAAVGFFSDSVLLDAITCGNCPVYHCPKNGLEWFLGYHD
ncbi:hypothetical protein NRI_0182 [Neorickettsia risticii str. Illinois]|uniref:Uncharacterized protein n=1 Tax=Neorickettsia risticii (strain Illinois) TaxID=434131 RepID=C6V458_NEORI|nr:hypothetical protein NRI_0182 [Neorickettsia risticii str. Illinois]